MYAKLVSLVGTGKDFTLCMQVVLYAKLVGTGKDFIFCMPSCGPLNLSDWLLVTYNVPYQLKLVKKKLPCLKKNMNRSLPPPCASWRQDASEREMVGGRESTLMCELRQNNRWVHSTNSSVKIWCQIQHCAQKWTSMCLGLITHTLCFTTHQLFEQNK